MKTATGLRRWLFFGLYIEQKSSHACVDKAKQAWIKQSMDSFTVNTRLRRVLNDQQTQ